MTTQIQDWAGSEPYLMEFEETWIHYRAIVKQGITQFPEVNIRDLFQELSIIQAHAEMRVSIAESKRDKRKLDLELAQASLLRTHVAGPMNKRMAEIANESEYQKALIEYNDAEDEVTIAKGSAKAATIAANALSRELSVRSKF